jgi:protease-4
MRGFFKSVMTTALGLLVGTVLSFIFSVVVFFILMRAIGSGGMNSIQPHSVLHVDLAGTLIERQTAPAFDFAPAFFSGEPAVGLYDVLRALDHAKSDARVDGVLVEYRGLAAGWSSIASLRRKLDEVKQAGKFVHFHATDLTEAGLYLASAATKSTMHPHGSVELNGFGLTEAFLKGLLEKLEVEPRIFRVGKFKSAIEPLILEKMSEANREQNQALVSDLWTEFRRTVSAGIKIDEARLDELAATAKVSAAEAAKAAGLVTDLQYIDQVRDELTAATNQTESETGLQLVSIGELNRDRRGSARSAVPGKGTVAVLFAEGEIIGSDGLPEEVISAPALIEEIRTLREDDEIKAVVLRVNSPGGDAIASDAIWRELQITDEVKPVIVSMGDLAASGGYYIAVGGRYIFAEPTTITGSIGVFGVLLQTDRLFKNKLGVGFDRVTTHPFSDFASSVRPISNEESAIIQTDVERVYARFLDVVQTARGYESVAALQPLAEGRVWTGLQAKEKGLVDELGGLEQAIAKSAEIAALASGEFKVEAFPKPRDPIKELITAFSESDLSARFGGSGNGGALLAPALMALRASGSVGHNLAHQSAGLRWYFKSSGSVPRVWARVPSVFVVE